MTTKMITMNGNGQYQVQLMADGNHLVHVQKTRFSRLKGVKGSTWLSVIKPQSTNWKKAVKLAKALASLDHIPGPVVEANGSQGKLVGGTRPMKLGVAGYAAQALEVAIPERDKN